MYAVKNVMKILKCMQFKNMVSFNAYVTWLLYWYWYTELKHLMEYTDVINLYDFFLNLHFFITINKLHYCYNIFFFLMIIFTNYFANIQQKFYLNQQQKQAITLVMVHFRIPLYDNFLPKMIEVIYDPVNRNCETIPHMRYPVCR